MFGEEGEEGKISDVSSEISLESNQKSMNSTSSVEELEEPKGSEDDSDSLETSLESNQKSINSQSSAEESFDISKEDDNSKDELESQKKISIDLTDDEQLVIDRFFVEEVFPHLSLKETLRMSRINKKFNFYARKKFVGKYILKEDGYKWIPNPNVCFRVYPSSDSIEIRWHHGRYGKNSDEEVLDQNLQTTFCNLDFIFKCPVRCDHLTIYSEVVIVESPETQVEQNYLWTFNSPPRKAFRETFDVRLYNIFKESVASKEYFWFTRHNHLSPEAVLELYNKIIKRSKVQLF